MKQKLKRLTALILALSMCLSMLSATAWAAETDAEEALSAEVIVEEADTGETESAAETEEAAEEVSAEDSSVEEPAEEEISVEEPDEEPPTEEASSAIVATEEEAPLTSDAVVTAEDGDETASGTCGDSLTWTLSGDGTLTISGSGAMTSWSSYSSVDWYSYRTSVTSVVVEDGVTSIESYAFYGCTALTTVTLHEGLTSIGYRAFQGCTSLTDITLPDSVTTLGYYIFSGCTSLTSINYPVSLGTCNTLNSYGPFANSSIETITIPDGVTAITKNAFAGCTTLANVVIPDSVTSIGNYAFYDCAGLPSITCTGSTGAVMPDSVTSIGDYAFRGCTGLTAIALPNSVTSIGDYAFYGCTGLENATLSEGLTSIGSNTFQNCTSLLEIEIPDGVATIGNQAFYGCTALTTVTLHEGLTSIGYRAFQGCTSLTDITLPDSVTTLGYYIFSGCTSLTSINYPVSLGTCNTLNSYGPFANSSIETITIPDGVTAITKNAFAGCTTLTTIVIPDSVTSIGNYAFYGCTSLATIVMPGSVTTIGNYATYNCSALADIYYELTEEDWGNISIGSNNTGIDNATIHYNCTIAWTWAEDYSSCTATYMSGDEAVWTFECTVTDNAVDATCTTDGYTAYTASFTWGGHTYQNVQTVKTATATGHTYGEPTFNWNSDYSACTAAVTCTSCGEKQTAACQVSSQITAATCTEDGVAVYTATCTLSGTTYTDTQNVTLVATGHTVVEAVGQDATCTEDGYTEYTYCSVCGEILSGHTTIPATGHTWNTGVVTVAATCTTDGVRTYTCTSCGETKTEAISATGHTEGKAVTENVVEATCTTDGSYDSVVYCTNCGEELSRETITVPATGHKYVAVVTEPTCTEKGYTTHTCSVCGDSYVADETDATGHTAGEAVIENVAEATCTTDGSYDTVVYCTVCGAEISRTTTTVPATGHKYVAVVTEPTCTEKGYTTYTCSVCGDSYVADETDATEHTTEIQNAKAATCTEDGYTGDEVCSVCGETVTAGTVISAMGHSWDDGVITKEATDTEDGVKTYTCTVCGETKTEIIPARGHTYGEPTFTWAEDYSTCTAVFTCVDGDDTKTVDCTVSKVTVAATCTEDGQVTYVATCTFNDAKYSDSKSVVISATGHSYVAVATEPTCTEKGYTTYTCSVCGDSYVADEIAATGHTTEIQNAKAATCTEDGYTGDEVCTVCGETVSVGEAIPATGHQYEAVVTEPTCTEGGYTTYTCSVCGDSYVADKTDATGHTTEIQNAKAATCTEDGYTGDEVCTVCGETVTAGTVISAMGHSWDDGVITKEATDTEDGVKTYTCTVCGETKTEVIPATGHTYGEPAFTWAEDYSTCTAVFTCVDGDDTKTVDCTVSKVTVAATCTEDGQVTYVATCTFNDAKYSDSKSVVISATGHSYVAVATEPTCTEKGYTTYTCSVCGDSYVADETDATGHTAGGAVTENVLEATCTTSGSYDSVVYCATCGEELSRETITVPATGHTFVDGVCTVCGEAKTTTIDLSTCTVTVASATYTGKALSPAVTVTDANGNVLVKGTDYTVGDAENLVNAGTYTIAITGMGNYTGTATATFTIAKASQTVMASVGSTTIYTGKTTTITASTTGDGAISYTSSDTSIATVDSKGVVTGKKPGTVTITVKAAATDNYKAASKTVKITVKLNKTTISSLTNTAKGITVKWSKVTGASGYYIYRNGKQVKKITSGSTVSWSDTGAKTNGTKYQYKIYAYYGSTKSAVSATKTIYYVTRPTISSLKNTSSKKMTVKWAKNAKATGYQIQYSTSSSFSSSKTVTVSNYKTVSKVITGLTKGKKYYVRVRAYKTVSGTKYYSAWSATKNVKISK